MLIKEILIERASPVVYHYTNVSSALKILQSNHFELSSVYGSIEQEHAPKGYPYFLSTTRTTQGGYHNIIGYSAVMFDLDGNFYNQKYKAKAVNYWGDRHNEYGRISEAEDRIFSKTPTIPIDGIVSMHVYSKPLNEKERQNWGSQLPAQVRKILIAAKIKGIKTYFYEDENAWRLQDKRKAIPITGERETLKGQEHTGKTYQSRSYIEPWLELIFKNKKEDLSERANKLRANMISSWNSASNDYDLANDLSGARKPGSGDREHAVKLIAIMKQNKWQNAIDVATALTKKWKDIAEIKY